MVVIAASDTRADRRDARANRGAVDSTVQAPQMPRPQPNLVPRSSSASRSTQSSGISGATVIERD